jgi:hypothetical protein
LRYPFPKRLQNLGAYFCINYKLRSILLANVTVEACISKIHPSFHNLPVLPEVDMAKLKILIIKDTYDFSSC